MIPATLLLMLLTVAALIATATAGHGWWVLTLTWTLFALSGALSHFWMEGRS